MVDTTRRRRTTRARGWVGTRRRNSRRFHQGLAEALDPAGTPLFVAAADGSQARKLVPGRVENAVWSPAGDRIAFDSLTGKGVPAWASPTRLGVLMWREGP